MWFSKYLFIGIGGAFFSLFFFGFPAFASTTAYISKSACVKLRYSVVITTNYTQIPLQKVSMILNVRSRAPSSQKVKLSIMPVHFLLLRRVVAILECYLLPLKDGGVEVVHDQDDGFLGAVVYVKLAL